MKQVRETTAGQSISAYVILKKGKLVATVQIHYGNSRVSVDIWDKTNGYEVQQGSAGGGGYDKRTAAMRGLTIDGIMLTNHCETDKRTERILKAYTKGELTQEEAEIKALRIGARFANYSTFFDGVKGYNFEGNKDKAEKTHRYTSLYLEPGLDKLKDLGYTIIQAI